MKWFGGTLHPSWVFSFSILFRLWFDCDFFRLWFSVMMMSKRSSGVVVQSNWKGVPLWRFRLEEFCGEGPVYMLLFCSMRDELCCTAQGKCFWRSMRKVPPGNLSGWHFNPSKWHVDMSDWSFIVSKWHDVKERCQKYTPIAPVMMMRWRITNHQEMGAPDVGVTRNISSRFRHFRWKSERFRMRLRSSAGQRRFLG